MAKKVLVKDMNDDQIKSSLQPFLQSELIIIRPLRRSDYDELYAVASDPVIWAQHPKKDRYKLDVFADLFEDSLNSGGAMVVIDQKTSRIIGSSRYYEINLEKKDIVIGYTFLGTKYWGGKYNRELKRLMIEHAFKNFDHILFHVDENNLRSRRAMEKIGGKISGEILKPERKVIVYRISKFLFSSPRLSFRPLMHNDLKDYSELETNPEVLKYYRRPPAKSMKEAESNLLSYVSYGERHPGLGAFSVFTKEDNTFIGIGVLFHMDKDPSREELEIGYRLQERHWGKGYATEIAEALVRYAFEERNLTEIYGTTHPDNIPSQKVLLKIGFKHVGEGYYHGGICKLYLLSRP